MTEAEKVTALRAVADWIVAHDPEYHTPPSKPLPPQAESLMGGLRKALETALSVAIHEQMDPACSGEPPYDVTHEQALALAEAVLRTPIVRAALAEPSRDAGLDVLTVTKRLNAALNKLGAMIVKDSWPDGLEPVSTPLLAAEYARLAAADGAPFPAGVNRADSEGER